MSFHRLFIWSFIVLLSGCASSPQRAPVLERGAVDQKPAAPKKMGREKDWRPEVHVVQKGETLYSIAFNYGFDYHELAELNEIKDPNQIQIGQQIRLFPGTTSRPAVAAQVKAVEPAIKEQPKLVKYSYSELALAQIDKMQETGKPAAVATAQPEVKSKPEPEAKPKPEPETKTTSDDSAEDADADLAWAMPAQGKLIAGFSESDNRKGIDIAGKLGQPVSASASGKVVYSGSGLRGYGKLIIIKHNKTYLSAYAHNDKVLVKEGQSVVRGQKIAEMGNTDADQVKLHFEVRRFGKPVDPAKYLSLGKS